MTETNRNYKDTVFTSFFSEKENLISAYNALAGTNYPLDTELRMHTLENVLYGAQRNDLAFEIGNRYIVLIEHQSTINENMPLRLLAYIARVYERLVPKKRLYQKKAQLIPEPEFFVIYNGSTPYPEKTTLKLSDLFMQHDRPPALELSVPVYNIADGKNEELLKRSKSLSDYATFVNIVKSNIRIGLTQDESIKKAIDDCRKNGIMKTYLAAHDREVRNMLITEFDVDEYIQVSKEEGFEEGREEGREEGAASKAKEMARGMKADGMSLDLIVKYTGLSEEEILAL
jgi:hypothetical protein